MKVVLRKAAMVSGVALAGAVLALILGPLQLRMMAARASALGYSVFASPQVTTGPAPVRIADKSAILQSLTTATSGTWKVNLSQPDALQLPFFMHEDTRSAAAAKFRNATSDLAGEPFDIFETARRIRRLSHHREEASCFGTIWDCLRDARQKRGLVCDHFVRLWVSVCATRGYSTRIIGLSTSGNHFDHAIGEVYLPEAGKWITVDVDFGMVYLRDNVMLNVHELQQAWQTVRNLKHLMDVSLTFEERQQRIRQTTGIHIVTFGDTERHLRDEQFRISPTGMNLELFEYALLPHRNDYLSHSYPPAHPARIGQSLLRIDGSRHLIDICPEAAESPEQLLYFPVSATWFEVITDQASAPHCLPLRFSTYTPNFEAFEVQVNQEPWFGLTGRIWLWQLHPGENQLGVRSRNHAGVIGTESRLFIQSAAKSNRIDAATADVPREQPVNLPAADQHR